MFRELCPISHLPFRPLPTGEQGREERSAGCAAAISSAFSFCAFRRASNSAMLGQSIRRFTTSVVRRSHYEEGPGKVSMEGAWLRWVGGTWLRLAELQGRLWAVEREMGTTQKHDLVVRKDLFSALPMCGRRARLMEQFYYTVYMCKMQKLSLYIVNWKRNENRKFFKRPANVKKEFLNHKERKQCLQELQTRCQYLNVSIRYPVERELHLLTTDLRFYLPQLYNKVFPPTPIPPHGVGNGGKLSIRACYSFNYLEQDAM
eukprot:bmy_16376T0